MDATQAELESMGFPPHLVHQALQRSRDAETAIEWILGRLGNDPAPDLPLSHLSNLDRLDHLDRLDRLDRLDQLHRATTTSAAPAATHPPASAAAATAAAALQTPEELVSAIGASPAPATVPSSSSSSASSSSSSSSSAAGASSSATAPIPIPRSSAHPLTGTVTRHPLSPDTGNKYEDEDVSRAIEESLRAGCDDSIDPNERRRMHPTPVGLKNVGNTCYFNTLLQSYFAIPTFRAFVLSLDFATYDPDPSVQFLHELQKLFGFMMLSDRKFVDPSMVIHTMLINSNRSIGAQEDPTEFSIIFVEAVQDGLKAYRRQRMQLSTPAETDGQTPPPTAEGAAPPASDAKDFIQQMFCAEQLQTVFVKRADGAPEELVQKTEFYQVILDVSCGDLYRGLDNYTSLTEIDDYAEPNYETHASKIVFFESFPPVLTLLLQRLDFDKTKNEAIKLHNAFTFDKHIYVDRYLHANMADTLARRERIKRKLDEMATIRQELDRLEHYQHGPVSICNHLRSVMNYLCERGDPDDQYTISKLGQYADDIDLQIANSHQLLSNLNDEVAAAFADAKKTVGYRLHAALVHDGTAINGHYWAFVYDAEKGLWYKHNDANVTQVDEELVLRETTGGDSKASGYCLIYINDRLFDEVNKETTKGYELIPLELQAIIADDNAAFADELHEWELRRAEREAAAQAEAQLRNKVELFKQEYHAHMDRLITRISEARSETEDHRLESFIHFLWEINSQDLAQTQIAETVYLQLFGERLDLVRRNRMVQLLAAEFTDVNFQPHTMAQRDELYILQAEYNKFLTTTRYLIAGLDIWHTNTLEGLRYIVYAMKYDLEIRYHEAHRDKELREYLLVMLYELSEAAKAKLMERDWGGGLDYAFTVATLLAQKVSRNNAIYLRLRDEWESIFARLHQSCRTLTPTMAYHREVIIKAERMYSNLGSNPNVYSFPQPSQPPNYPNIAECYRTVKERAVVKRMQLLEQLEAPYMIPELPPFVEEEPEPESDAQCDDNHHSASQTPTNDRDADEEDDEADDDEDEGDDDDDYDDEEAAYRGRDAHHA